MIFILKTLIRLILINIRIRLKGIYDYHESENENKEMSTVKIMEIIWKSNRISVLRHEKHMETCLWLSWQSHWSPLHKLDIVFDFCFIYRTLILYIYLFHFQVEDNYSIQCNNAADVRQLVIVDIGAIGDDSNVDDELDAGHDYDDDEDDNTVKSDDGERMMMMMILISMRW